MVRGDVVVVVLWWLCCGGGGGGGGGDSGSSCNVSSIDALFFHNYDTGSNKKWISSLLTISNLSSVPTIFIFVIIFFKPKIVLRCMYV